SSVLSLLTACLVGYWLVPSEPYSVRQFRRGMDLYRLGHFQEAMEYLDHAGRLDPENPDVQVARGRAFQRIGQFDSAGVAYLAALNLHPEDRVKARVKALYGYCLGRMGFDQDAFAYDTAAIEAGFETAEVYNNRGYSLLKEKRLDEAQEDFSKALKLDSS